MYEEKLYKKECFDDLGQDIQRYAKQRSERRGDSEVLPSHLLLGLTDLKSGPVFEFLSSRGTISTLRSEIGVGHTSQGTFGFAEKQFSEPARKVLDLAYSTASSVGLTVASDVHILYGLSLESPEEAKTLKKIGFSEEEAGSLVDRTAYKRVKFRQTGITNWVVPTTRMTLTDYFHTLGFDTTDHIRDGDSVHFNVVHNGVVFCEVPIVNADSNALPTIIYDPSSDSQLILALSLRHLLRRSNQPYAEKPLPTTIARQVSSRNKDLAARLVSLE